MPAARLPFFDLHREYRDSVGIGASRQDHRRHRRPRREIPNRVLKNSRSFRDGLSGPGPEPMNIGQAVDFTGPCCWFPGSRAEPAPRNDKVPAFFRSLLKPGQWHPSIPRSPMLLGRSAPRQLGHQAIYRLYSQRAFRPSLPQPPPPARSHYDPRRTAFGLIIADLPGVGDVRGITAVALWPGDNSVRMVKSPLTRIA